MYNNLNWICSFRFLSDLLGTTSNQTYEVLAGNREWMKRNGLDVTVEMNSILEQQEALGQTAIMCAIDGKNALHRTMYANETVQRKPSGQGCIRSRNAPSVHQECTPDLNNQHIVFCFSR